MAQRSRTATLKDLDDWFLKFEDLRRAKTVDVRGRAKMKNEMRKGETKASSCPSPIFGKANRLLAGRSGISSNNRIPLSQEVFPFRPRLVRLSLPVLFLFAVDRGLGRRHGKNFASLEKSASPNGRGVYTRPDTGLCEEGPSRQRLRTGATY
eukprot:Selendium_serpulae@DN1452_c0_g1_i1.p1